LDRFQESCLGADAGETIRDIRAFTRMVAESELERTLNKLDGPLEKNRQEMETLVHRILGKILHPASENLRTAYGQGQGQEASDWARRLFGLGMTKGND